jgi:hypothetical protein
MLSKLPLNHGLVLNLRHTTTMHAQWPGWGGRWHHGAAALNGSLVVVGGWGEAGYLKDVWSSKDGRAPWTLLNAVC